jgi:hypothetical protein
LAVACVGPCAPPPPLSLLAERSGRWWGGFSAGPTQVGRWHLSRVGCRRRFQKYPPLLAADLAHHGYDYDADGLQAGGSLYFENDVLYSVTNAPPVRKTAVVEAPCSQFVSVCQQFGAPRRLNITAVAGRWGRARARPRRSSARPAARWPERPRPRSWPERGCCARPPRRSHPTISCGRLWCARPIFIAWGGPGPSLFVWWVKSPCARRPGHGASTPRHVGWIPPRGPWLLFSPGVRAGFWAAG